VIPRKLQYIVAALVLAILGMGLYLVHLKRKAEFLANPPATQALTAPVSGPAGEMTLYLASDEDDSLRPITMVSAQPSDPGERGRLALHTLILRYQQKDSAHMLGAGADVHDVYLLDPSSAVVNLNSVFADSHRSGVEVEQLTVFSMVLTLKAQLPQLTRVRFLVEGKTRDTLAGHIDISAWLDAVMVAEAATELK
jgi:hypothetical protein